VWFYLERMVMALYLEAGVGRNRTGTGPGQQCLEEDLDTKVFIDIYLKEKDFADVCGLIGPFCI
jgi:hypothetical protein